MFSFLVGSGARKLPCITILSLLPLKSKLAILAVSLAVEISGLTGCSGVGRCQNAYFCELL